MPTVDAVARSLHAPHVGTSPAELSVQATTVAPATLSAGTAFGGPPGPAASTGGTPMDLTGTARAADTVFPRRSREVVVALVTAAGALTAEVSAAAARGTDSTIRSGVWRSVASIAPVHARRVRGRAAEALLAQRRRRIDWELVGRDRLLRAWKSVLREHGFPAGEVRLVGIFGPTPLGALEGVAHDASGDAAIVALRRSRVPGPTGHVALARHVPSGRLLTVLLPGD